MYCALRGQYEHVTSRRKFALAFTDPFIGSTAIELHLCHACLGESWKYVQVTVITILRQFL